MKKRATGAISSIKGDEVNKMSTSDFGSAIQGKLVGVMCDKAMLLQVKMLK